LLDQDACLDLIDQMRLSVPEEIRQAKRVQQERDRIVAQGKEEAERVVALAREQASRLVDDHELVQEAKAKVEAVLERARHESQEIRTDADKYAADTLSELESRLTTLLNEVKNGLAVLNRRVADSESTNPDDLKSRDV